MKRFQAIIRALRGLHKLSRIAVEIGAAWMSGMYVVACIARLMAPYATNYFYAMSVYRGALEAAPACLAVGVCAGLIGDLMLHEGRPKDDPSDSN